MSSRLQIAKQNRPSAIAFMVGTCPFCGVPPAINTYIGETDILYRCPTCDFPVEAFTIMAFLDRFEEQMDNHIEQIDLMLQKRELLVK